jgi:DNA-directed RNA polymerase subunit RPC12/RpoP
MAHMKCRQCGTEFSAARATECPSCGDTLLDEFEQVLKEKVRISRRSYAGIAVLSVAVLVLCFWAVDESRHYYWDEPKTSPVTDKQTVTESKTKDGHTTTTTKYYLYLSDGHKETVTHSVYDSYRAGENYTYNIRHRDWRPGMENAPVPQWVWIAPVAIVLVVVIALQLNVMAKRRAELEHWRATGDLDTDNAPEEAGTDEGEKKGEAVEVEEESEQEEARPAPESPPTPAQAPSMRDSSPAYFNTKEVPAPGVPAPPAPDQRKARLEQLEERLLEGKISERTYLELKKKYEGGG